MVLSDKDVPGLARKTSTHPFLQKYDKFPNAPSIGPEKERFLLTKHIGEKFPDKLKKI